MERGLWNITAINYIYYIEFYCFFFNFPCYIKITHFKLFIHLFIFKQKLAVELCEIGFWECSSSCWAATQEPRPQLLSLERGVNSRALPNSVSSLACHPHTSPFSSRGIADSPSVITPGHETAWVMHTPHPYIVIPSGCGNHQWPCTVNVIFRVDWPCVLLGKMEHCYMEYSLFFNAKRNLEKREEPANFAGSTS